jgi:O-succinylbenzoate synthase
MGDLKIDRIELAKYRLPLTRRFRAGGVDVSDREGRLVRLASDGGLEAYGEISPLPGVHRETVADAERVLAQVAGGIRGRSYDRFGVLAQNVGDRVAACAPGDALGYPSVCFGLQAAGAGLFALAEGTTPASVWSRTPRPEVALNGLFAGGLEEAVDALAEGSLERYPAVKVKVGTRPRAEEKEILRTLLAGLPETTRLRLDANRGLTVDEATARFGRLPPERIEYLEEPLAKPAELAELYSRTGLPMALDETLREPEFATLGRTKYVTTWILKPAAVGHWKRLRFLADDAAKRGKHVVVSSTLESGLGLWALVQVAASLPAADVPAGLATEGLLKVDIVEPRYDSSRGVMRTADWRPAPAPGILERLKFRPIG